MLSCSASGEFRHCEASGHAGFAKRGKDIVCSAVTIVLKTALLLLSDLSSVNNDSISLITETASRGNLNFSIAINDEAKDKLLNEVSIRLMCIADFIRSGITSVSKEYPDCVQLSEHRLDF